MGERTMAVTHADLEPSRRRDLRSKTGVFLMVFTILLGLSCFVLCLMAEATRSDVSWISRGDDDKEKGRKSECVYSGSGKVALVCAASAFVGLAIAMIVEHGYILVAVSKSSPNILSWDPHSPSAKSLTCQAGFFFVTTWICFGVGEMLLLAGVSVESGHLRNWTKPRANCLVVREGVYSAAGVFGLTTVFLASGLYLTALRAQRISQHLHNLRTHVLEASALYASPPTSLHNHQQQQQHIHLTITTIAAGDPTHPHNQCLSNKSSNATESMA